MVGVNSLVSNTPIDPVTRRSVKLANLTNQKKYRSQVAVYLLRPANHRLRRPTAGVLPLARSASPRPASHSRNQNFASRLSLELSTTYSLRPSPDTHNPSLCPAIGETGKRCICSDHGRRA